MNPLQQTIEQFLYRKSELCDGQDWDAYLALFDEQCEFHVPQWDSEHEYTTDPRRGMSLIYYDNRTGLEDRVYRLRTGKSAASTPLPRTMHQISNIRSAEHFFGRATYRLRWDGGNWRITRKHVLLLNDKINSVLDFYHL